MSPWSIAIGSTVWLVVYLLLYWAVQTGLRAVPTEVGAPGSWSAMASAIGLGESWGTAVLMVAANWLGLALTVVLGLAAAWWSGRWWAWWVLAQDASPACWSCGYDVRANPAGPCGECGAELNYASDHSKSDS